MGCNKVMKIYYLQKDFRVTSSNEVLNAGSLSFVVNVDKFIGKRFIEVPICGNEEMLGGLDEMTMTPTLTPQQLLFDRITIQLDLVIPDVFYPQMVGNEFKFVKLALPYTMPIVDSVDKLHIYQSSNVDWHTANQFCLNKSQILIPDHIAESVHGQLTDKRIHPPGTVSTIKQNFFQYTDAYWKTVDNECACNVTINQCQTEDHQGCTRKAAIICYEQHVPGQYATSRGTYYIENIVHHKQEEANGHCRTKGGVLATFPEQEDWNDFRENVQIHLQSTPVLQHYWIGLTQENGAYKWLTGEALTYGQPSTGDCFYVTHGSTTWFKSSSCDYEKHIVCKIFDNTFPNSNGTGKYHLIQADRKRQSFANEDCETKKGKLATFKTESEWDAFFGQIPARYAGDSFWIGLQRQFGNF
uniref:C-type lectin domain-containing protein n=1 Tax=Clytia hemisphaerica TaxID=252671 RepID=A0A7M5VG39_9CNID